MTRIIQLLVSSLVFVIIYSCGSSNLNSKNMIDKEEPVVIANDSLEYEITIIDFGFNDYLNSRAQPRGFYSQSFFEARNKVWVTIWNQRVLNPSQFDPRIYENQIDYSPNIDYGYEVNYLLFNYFLFAQRKYNMSLGGGFRQGRIN